MPVITDPCAPMKNRLLAMLPREECGRILPHLEQVPFKQGEEITASGEYVRAKS